MRCVCILLRLPSPEHDSSEVTGRGLIRFTNGTLLLAQPGYAIQFPTESQNDLTLLGYAKHLLPVSEGEGKRGAMGLSIVQ